MAEGERGKVNAADYADLKYGKVLIGAKSVFARIPEDKVKDETLYLHHEGANSFTIYQESSKGIKVLVNVVGEVTTALSNYPLKENEHGTVYVAHPSIPTDLKPEEVQELFIEK